MTPAGTRNNDNGGRYVFARLLTDRRRRVQKNTLTMMKRFNQF